MSSWEDMLLFVQHMEYTEESQGSSYSAVMLLSNEIVICILTQ